jgi:type II secretory pathway component PulC
MERDPSTGRVIVTSIARDGLFASTALAVGDIVLSFNRKRFSDDSGEGLESLESLENIVRKHSTICVAFKKPDPAAGAPLLSRRKKQNNKSRNNIGNKSNISSRGPPRDNNTFRINRHYGGMAQHNADGSLKFQKRDEGASSDDNDTMQGPITTKTLTISASKPLLSGSTLQQRTSRFGSRSSSNHRSSNHRSSNHRSSNHRNDHEGQQQSDVGLELAVIDKLLVVTAIHSRSIFSDTKLRPGDVLLSVNDMCFRKFPDADYAATIMNKVSLLVTLVVERPADDADDDTEQPENGWFDDSLSSFGNDEHEDDTNHKYAADASEAFSGSHSNTSSSTDTTTNVPIQRSYIPVTISVPKSLRSEDAGLGFRMVRTKLYKRKELWICVDKIERQSIFRNTSLRKGDKIICINDVDLRGNPDPRAAYQACYDANEAIAMIVLQKEERCFGKGMRVSLGGSASGFE